MMKKFIREQLLSHPLYQQLLTKPVAFRLSSYHRKYLGQVDKLLLFVGWGRTGSTLVGALLNAHPQMAISNEMLWCSDLFELSQNLSLRKTHKLTWGVDFTLDRDMLLGYLAKISESQNVIRQAGYSYRVLFDNNQGRARPAIKVVGNKGAAHVARFFARGGLESFQRLDNHWRLNTHFICIVRNPYDVITTTCLRQTEEAHPLSFPRSGSTAADLMKTIVEQNYLETARGLLPSCVELFAERCEGVRVLCDSGRFPIYFVHYTDLTASPEETIRSLTEFLGVASPHGYLRACAGLVRPASETRAFLEQFWSDDLMSAVQTLIDKHQWLRRYAVDGPHTQNKTRSNKRRDDHVSLR